MNEDQARNRTENLALLLRIALNPGSGPGQARVRAENSMGSMRGKLKRAAWQDESMLDLIQAAIPA